MVKSIWQKIGVVAVEDPVAEETPSAPVSKKQSGPYSVVDAMQQVHTDVQAKVSVEGGVAPTGLDNLKLDEGITANITTNSAFATANEFFKVNESLVAIIADEGTRFKAALAAAKLSAPDVINSVSYFSQGIELEQQSFDSSFVAGANDEIAELNQRIASTADEIQQLSTKITELAGLKADLEAQSAHKLACLEYAKIDFATVTKKIAARYSDIVAKLNKYTLGE